MKNTVKVTHQDLPNNFTGAPCLPATETCQWRVVGTADRAVANQFITWAYWLEDMLSPFYEGPVLRPNAQRVYRLVVDRRGGVVATCRQGQIWCLHVNGVAVGWVDTDRSEIYIKG